MQKFVSVKGRAAPMMQANIDTGAMINSKWARDTNNDILGSKLFGDWRYEADDVTEKPDFILNKPKYRDAQVLVAGKNFGCGSSRERAVWALMQYGFKAVISSSFGEIFIENCYQNGLCPVVLPEKDVQTIAEGLEANPEPSLSVDLESGTVTAENGKTYKFTMPKERRVALLEGLDELDQLLRYDATLKEFQASDRGNRPWIYERNSRR
jgi:3-isopropylmalate/(R)-2-methylmalate dehydratase small subunit